MKRIFSLFILLLTLAAWQGCKTKTTEAAAATKDSIARVEEAQAKKTSDLAAKRAKHLKASAEKEAQRKLVLAEKIKMNSTYKNTSGKIIYYKAEVDPAYNGGADEMNKYLKDNLKYPEEARDKGLEGTVFVDFVVDNTGKVIDVVTSDIVGEGVDASLKDESMRVVAAMPGWKSGLQHGKAVDTSFSIPITFQLEN